MSAYKIRKRHRTFAGTTGFYTHDSELTKQPMNFSVFEPDISRTRKTPAIYFLSGLSCTEENFMIKAGAQRMAAALGLTIICCDTSPRGLNIPGVRDHWDFGEGAGFYVNATQEPWSQNFLMYDYVTRELPHFIESNFAVIPDLKSIMGHSMGGHGALVIGLRETGSYRSISAFSPIASPTRCPWGEKAFTRYLGSDRKDWKAYDASLLISETNVPIPIKIDQGTLDEFLESQLKPQLLLEACQESARLFEFRMREGYDHSYYFISTFIGEHLEFHAKHLA